MVSHKKYNSVFNSDIFIGTVAKVIYRPKLRRLISSELGMLQNSQRESSLVHSSQQMSV